VVGAGVTGALVADALSSAGLDVVVLDRGQPGLGSTSASTALIQFELDIELGALGDLIGPDRALRAYRRCRDAIPRLETVCRDLGGCGYASRSSLYLASARRDRSRLMKEAELRRDSGLDAEWWPKEQVEQRYGFPSHGAIRTSTAGELDALALTRALLARATEAGCRVYSRTAMTGYATTTGGVVVETNRRHRVSAGTLVFALGYEVPSIIRQDLVKLNSSYAIATEVVDDFGRWDDRCLVWESARPYCYLRTTSDNRVLVGGEDVPFRDPAWRDRLLPERRKRLERRLGALLPSLDTRAAFAWAGTFAETSDGLPFIGRVDGVPHVVFALGYGGNGITFSLIASELLSDACRGCQDRDAALFAIDRPRPR
jgi:glycine/D-amino acid oxidase-like deaminating enzyme